MTAETLDTLRRDMTAAAASLADAENGAKSAYESMLTAALPIANAVEEGRPVADSAVAAFRIRREALPVEFYRANLARERFHRAAERFHAAESANRDSALADERRDRAIAAFNRAKGDAESARILANIGDERRLQEGR